MVQQIILPFLGVMVQEGYLESQSDHSGTVAGEEGADMNVNVLSSLGNMNMTRVDGDFITMTMGDDATIHTGIDTSNQRLS